MTLFVDQAELKRVIDGDTAIFHLDLGYDIRKETVRVRLRDIDTAEIHGVRHDSAEYARGIEQTSFIADWLMEGRWTYDPDVHDADGGDSTGRYPFYVHSDRWERGSFGRVLGHVARKIDAYSYDEARTEGLDWASVILAEYGDEYRYRR